MQDNKSYENDYIQLNLKDLFWSILRHWRTLLAAFLIGGLLLAAFGAFREYRNYTSASVREARQKAYEEALENYELQKARLETDLNNLQNAQDMQMYYQENALMLQIDQYNVSFVTASFCVQRDVEDTPETYLQNQSIAAALLKRYQAALDQLDLDKVIADAEHPHLTSSNPAGTNRKMLETKTDNTNTVLSLTIYGDSAARVEKIYAAVKETINAQHELLVPSVGAHRLVTIAENSYAGVDSEIGKVQTTFQTGLKTVSDAITETNKNLSALKAPSNSASTLRSVVKQGIKYGVIGAAFGLLVIGFWLLLKLILQDRLNSTGDVALRYGLPVLGVYAGKKEAGKLDRLIAKKLGLDLNRPGQESAELTAANTRLHLKDAAQLLLVGNCSKEKLNAVRDMLSRQLEDVQITTAGKVNESAAAVKALQEGTAVICVEGWMETPHKEIRRELQTVAAAGCRNLGVIVVCE